MGIAIAKLQLLMPKQLMLYAVTLCFSHVSLAIAFILLSMSLHTYHFIEVFDNKF